MSKSVCQVLGIGLIDDSVIVLPIRQKVEELVLALGHGNLVGLGPVIKPVHKSGRHAGTKQGNTNN